MPSLFDPLALKSVTLKNRIAVSPMCQYSADEGVVTDWHLVHLGALARGGAGLVIAEATAVSPEGRITPGCTGLWNDSQAEAFARVVKIMKGLGTVPGIQIGHAGRKASANRPWEGDDHIPEGDPRGWQPIAPSALAFGAHLPRTPRAMTLADIQRVRGDFVSAARRALDAGFEWLELHFAHGYLGQSFFSPRANHRDDAYGGPFENRIRFLVETFEAVRAVWPDRLPLTARLGVTEFDGRDEDLEESIELVKRLKAAGLDLIDVSVGFTTPNGKIPWGPAFMAPFAERIRREVGIAAATSWLITEPAQADALIKDEKVDLVALGRRMLQNPHWPYHAAGALVPDAPARTLPPQYAHWLKTYGPG